MNSALRTATQTVGVGVGSSWTLAHLVLILLDVHNPSSDDAVWALLQLDVAYGRVVSNNREGCESYVGAERLNSPMERKKLQFVLVIPLLGSCCGS